MLLRIALGFLLTVTLVAVAAPSARACSEEDIPIAYEPGTGRPIYGYTEAGLPVYVYMEPGEDPIYWWEAVLIGQAAMNLTFLGLDIGYGVANEIPSGTYAGFEIAAAVVNTLATVAWGVVGFIYAAAPCGGLGTDRVYSMPFAAGVSHLFALTFYIHGIWALLRDEDAGRWTVAPMVSIGAEGFSVGVAGLLD